MNRTVINFLITLAISVILIGVSSCSGLIGEIVANRVVEKLNRIDHYQAEIRALGAEKSAIRLYYTRFWHIHQEIVGPSPSEGELFLFDGDRFLFYSPARRIAFMIKGINEPTLEEWKLFMKQRMARSKETTQFRKEGKGSIMGRKAALYRSSPKSDKSILPIVSLSWIDKETGLPLKVVQYRQDGSIFKGFEHTHIDFETPLAPEAFQPSIKPDTKVIEWDLQRKAQGIHRGERIIRPNFLPKGLSIKNTIHSSQAPEMRLALYENRPLFLIFGQWPADRVPLPFSGGSLFRIGEREFRFLYFSGLHLVHFKWKGRRIVLFSNLTLNDLLGIRWAEALTAASSLGIHSLF
jgi:outer membrane lipoprotein-sorting protein